MEEKVDKKSWSVKKYLKENELVQKLVTSVAVTYFFLFFSRKLKRSNSECVTCNDSA